MLGHQVFSQPEFKHYAAQHLVLLEVDFPRKKELSAGQKAANEKLAERFGIYGFPTVIILDPSGKKIGELGYMPGGPEAFIAAVEKLRRAG
jgi:protein disulfide-isomerase